MEICARVQLPRIQCNFDNYHFAFTGEPLELLRQHMGFVAHVHLCNPVYRQFPLNGREEDYLSIFNVLNSAGYEGMVSLEACSSDMMHELKASVKLLKHLECIAK